MMRLGSRVALISAARGAVLAVYCGHVGPGSDPVGIGARSVAVGENESIGGVGLAILGPPCCRKGLRCLPPSDSQAQV